VRTITNKFHFIEIDWIIYFPSIGNKGRNIVKYGVAYRDRINKKTQPGRKINLSDVLKQDTIKNRYPHTVGLFYDKSGKGINWKPRYIENRIIRSENELLDWIKTIEEK
jgi:hypothetical protein